MDGNDEIGKLSITNNADYTTEITLHKNKTYRIGSSYNCDIILKSDVSETFCVIYVDTDGYVS